MNQKHLLRFIKKKMRACPDDVVIDSKGVRLTLTQVSAFMSQTCILYDATYSLQNVHVGISTVASESLRFEC